jgi:HD-like signal output (HDOD) protein
MKAEKGIDLPPLPTIVSNVMRFDPGAEGSDSRALELIIAPDKAICSDVLRVANSAFYGRSGRIGNMKDAITLLGLKAVRNLVIFLSTRNLAGSLKLPIFRKYLREFPIVSALIARRLSEQTGLGNPEEAFLCGLLHKIGMTILALKQQDRYASLLEYAEKNDKDVLLLEDKLLQTNHVTVGKSVFEAWNLPGELQKVIYEAENAEIPQVRLTFLAGHLGRKLMGLRPTKEELAMLDRSLKQFTDTEFMYSYDAAYYAQLKQHPYYVQAMA